MLRAVRHGSAIHPRLADVWLVVSLGRKRGQVPGRSTNLHQTMPFQIAHRSYHAGRLRARALGVSDAHHEHVGHGTIIRTWGDSVEGMVLLHVEGVCNLASTAPVARWRLDVKATIVSVPRHKDPMPLVRYLHHDPRFVQHLGCLWCHSLVLSLGHDRNHQAVVLAHVIHGLTSTSGESEQRAGLLGCDARTTVVLSVVTGGT